MKLQLGADEARSLLKAQIKGELPDRRGRFGPFGGCYAPETLMPALQRLEAGVREYLHTPEFQAELGNELQEWVGRPTALTHARGLSSIRLSTMDRQSIQAALAEMDAAERREAAAVGVAVARVRAEVQRAVDAVLDEFCRQFLDVAKSGGEYRKIVAIPIKTAHPGVE